MVFGTWNMNSMGIQKKINSVWEKRKQFGLHWDLFPGCVFVPLLEWNRNGNAELSIYIPTHILAFVFIIILFQSFCHPSRYHDPSRYYDQHLDRKNLDLWSQEEAALISTSTLPGCFNKLNICGCALPHMSIYTMYIRVYNACMWLRKHINLG